MNNNNTKKSSSRKRSDSNPTQLTQTNNTTEKPKPSPIKIPPPSPIPPRAKTLTHLNDLNDLKNLPTINEKIPVPALSRSVSDVGHASPIHHKIPPALQRNFSSFKDLHSIKAKMLIPSDCSSTTSIKKCECIKRLIYVLKYYESMDIIKNNDKNNISKLIQFIDATYKTHRLLDDFIHINTVHNSKLEHVQKYMVKELNIKTCDINHCLSLARHNRDRNLDRNHNEEKEEEHWIFIRDTFDNIHSYLFHTFDMGLRIKQKELEKMTKSKHEHEYGYEKDADSVETVDGYFKQVTHHLRKNNKKLKSFSRFKGKKFQIDTAKMDRIATEKQRGMTWTDALCGHLEDHGVVRKEIDRLLKLVSDEGFDSDAIIEDTEDFSEGQYIKNTSNIISSLNNDKTKLKLIYEYANDSTLRESSFSTGFLFYYWPYYKNKIKIRHKYDSINHCPKKLYITKKYENLQHEILNNKLYTLKHFQFMDCIKKAKHYVNTEKVKSITSCSDYVHHSIPAHSPITIDHLLSVILYTDWSDLCTSFSSTFRRQRSFEALKSIKKRNSEYWNFSKLLRECVESYGEHKGYFDVDKKKWTGVAGPFFCGMSFCAILNSFNIRLYGPTSTSKQIEVATRFGGDHGIIIELDNNGDWNAEYLRCFNCSWISNFNGEEERLFFGGRYRMKVNSIRKIETRQDFRPFFHALFYFDCMLNGTEMEKNTENEIKKMDFGILEKLIQHKLRLKKNKFLDYINKTFEIFCVSKREITLNLQSLDVNTGCFAKLRGLIMKSGSNLCMDVIFRLFKNLRVVIMETTQRVPYKEHQFKLGELCRLLDIGKMNCAENLRIIVKAHKFDDWDTGYRNHPYQYRVKSVEDMDWDPYNYTSWLHMELENRFWNNVDDDRYKADLSVEQVKGRYLKDCATIYKV